MLLLRWLHHHLSVGLVVFDSGGNVEHEPVHVPGSEGLAGGSHGDVARDRPSRWLPAELGGSGLARITEGGGLDLEFALSAPRFHAGRVGGFGLSWTAVIRNILYKRSWESEKILRFRRTGSTLYQRHNKSQPERCISRP